MLLQDLQRHFKNSIFASEDRELDSCICENGLSVKQRLQVYRNNFFITLTKTLQDIYPAVQKIVGEDFFAGMAREYITCYPSTSRDLHVFGHNFAEFIVAFPPAKVVPYLADVARLEWAYHEVFYEAPHALLDLSRLREVTEESYGSIKFKLHLASRLLMFAWPVLHIWQICQKEKDDEEKVDLAEGGEKILVIRRELEVTFEKLSEGEYVLLTAINQGKLFAEACALALQVESNFDVNFYLQKHLLQNTIVNFSL